VDTSDPAPTYEIVDTPAGQMIILPPDGDVFERAEDFMDLVGNASWQSIAWVVVPAERVADDFFRLRTGFAGEVAQKFVNYRVGLAVLGDIDRFSATSPTLRDLMRESNDGRQLWFVHDRAGLDAKIDRLGPTRP